MEAFHREGVGILQVAGKGRVTEEDPNCLCQLAFYLLDLRLNQRENCFVTWFRHMIESAIIIYKFKERKFYKASVVCSCASFLCQRRKQITVCYIIPRVWLVMPVCVERGLGLAGYTVWNLKNSCCDMKCHKGRFHKCFYYINRGKISWISWNFVQMPDYGSISKAGTFK